MRRLSPLALSCGLALAGCRTEQTWIEPDPHLERMLVQPKRLAYGQDPTLAHGMVMQNPPEGTMPTEALFADPRAATGASAGRWAERVPVPVSRAMIERGRANFDTFCAACHGVLGDGASAVAGKMALRKPPNLHEARIRAYPPGRVFATIREGYGLMPSYSAQLSISDAWGVAEYLRALQLARAARASDLPREVREKLAKEAP
jgi:mono/diheme cytochrome c family protein